MAYRIPGKIERKWLLNCKLSRCVSCARLIAVGFVLTTCCVAVHAMSFCSTLIFVLVLLVGGVALPTDPNVLHLLPADLRLCLEPLVPASPMRCPKHLSGMGHPVVLHTHQRLVVRRPTHSSSHVLERCLTRAQIRCIIFYYNTLHYYISLYYTLLIWLIILVPQNLRTIF